MAPDPNVYKLLPSHPDTPLPVAVQRAKASHWPRIPAFKHLSLRRPKVVFGLLLLFLCISALHRGSRIWSSHDSPLYPPLYEKYHERELALPQHDPDLPPPEGGRGKYLWVSSHMDNGFGWGNYMQEFVLDAWLAHKAGRAIVFDNYTWDRHGPEYSSYHGNLIPSRIPLSAMLAGPIVGGPFPDGDSSPRSVRKEYFDTVCPDPAKINGHDVADQYIWGSTKILAEKWLERFQAVDNRCIEIVEGTAPPFGLWVSGTTHVLDVWPELSMSPLITAWRWSPLIEAGVAANLPLIHPLAARSAASRDSVLDTYPYTAIPGLLVLQLRRGDYEEHCGNLLNWGAEWQGFNRFPQFPDHFTTVPGAGTSNVTEEARAEHYKRCFPNPGQVAEKVREILQTDAGKGLKSVYIMTNGKLDFIVEVKQVLRGVHTWASITSSRDLVVDLEQQYVKQAIDMLIGLRAQVIIGNGWSSMSSNIVMLRMALLNLSPDHVRFW